MKYYIGLGGIGCRTLQDYYSQCAQKENKEFFYVDNDITTKGPENYFFIPSAQFGTGMRRGIGRNLTNYALYAEGLSEAFSGIKLSGDVELIFVVSSFGGFGSAAVVPIMDYLEAVTWHKLKSCTVIGFNENAYGKMGIPKLEMQKFEANTIDFISDLNSREQTSDFTNESDKAMFNPGCRSFLIDTGDISPESFWKYIDASESELRKLDCRKNEKYSVQPVRSKKPVFISYSSKDQAVADLVADELDAAGIGSWIATRDIKAGSYAKQIIKGIREASIFLVLISENSIRSEQVKNEIDRAFARIQDGMTIFLFILDDSALDDECEYYLSRQRWVFGNKPPLEERVKELISEIQDCFV